MKLKDLEYKVISCEKVSEDYYNVVSEYSRKDKKKLTREDVKEVLGCDCEIYIKKTPQKLIQGVWRLIKKS